MGRALAKIVNQEGEEESETVRSPAGNHTLRYSSKYTRLKGSKHRRSVSDILCVDENTKTRSGNMRPAQNVIKEDDDIDIAENFQTGLTKLFGPTGAPRSTGQAEALRVIL